MRNTGGIRLKVHEAAQRLGITPRTLRFYEEKGLVHPVKAADSGYRQYSEEDMKRLRWIVALRELGMPIHATAEAVGIIENKAAFLRKVDEARALLYEEWLASTQKLQALDHTLEAWQQQPIPELALAEQLAGKLKHIRTMRSAWRDEWDYDKLALLHGQSAPQAALASQLTPLQYEEAHIRTVDWIDPAQCEHGLELGAGTGNLTVKLAAAGARMSVIEQSAEMLAVLRSRLPNVEQKLGNMLALPIGAQAYSFVVCSFAIRHLNPSQQIIAITEIDRVLAPQGRIVITDIQPQPKEQPILPSTSNNDILPCNEEVLIWLQEHGYSIASDYMESSVTLLIAVR